MFNRSKSKKIDLYTQKEALAVSKEVKKFFDALEKRDGKKFNQSFGTVVAVIFKGEDGKPQGSFTHGNANTFTMMEVAESAVKALAKNKKEPLVKICADIAFKAMLS